VRRTTIATWLTIVIGVVLSGAAHAQYFTDDPGTIEPKHAELSVGYTSASETPGKDLLSTPGMVLRYGLNDRMQVRLDFGVATKRSGKVQESGLADTNVYLKWRFKDETKKTPQLALVGFMKAPTADAQRGIGTGKFDEKFWLCAAKSFKRYKMWAYAGGYYPGLTPGARNGALYGVANSFQLTEKLVVGAELYGNTSVTVNKSDELAWDVVMKYNYAPDRNFKFRVGRSMKGFSDLNLSASLGFIFK